eukprot:8566941-Pyramimonas_sp.AAC.1
MNIVNEGRRVDEESDEEETGKGTEEDNGMPPQPTFLAAFSAREVDRVKGAVSGQVHALAKPWDAGA